MRILVACLGLFLCASVALAANIKLKNGTQYTGVTILNRTPTSVEIQVPSGSVTLWLADIQTIDGVDPNANSLERLRPLAPDTTHAIIITNQTTVVVPYVHNWKMEGLIAILAIVFSAWISIALWVQSDAQGSAAEIKRYNTDVLLLPGLGLFMYLIAKSRRAYDKMEKVDKNDDRTLGSRVSGLNPDEAPKKRGLFAGRALFAAAFSSAKKGLALEFLDANRNVIEIRKDMPEMSGIEAAREVLEGAIAERASDIHIEPHDTGCRVRFRVDGVLQERMSFERSDGTRMTAALKTLAQIDVAERRKAQDGRFRVRTTAGEVDFRVASASSIYGEKLVLRILDRKSGVLSLTDLGMSPKMLEKFDKIIHSRNGLILATGPTGSGKTSTLYAAISRLDAKHLNIMTIEDPVEYELEGATQMAVNVKAGITFEAGLRSMLRQDPDIIFVGEMRDKEASSIAVRAALTGHLVFSSLHTQDAPGSIVRLTEMGVERYQVSSALLLVITQRLVRVLCPDCKEPYPSTGRELVDINIEIPAGERIYRSTGCPSCDQTGFQGRTGIFEMLVIDDELRKEITNGAGQQEITEIALKKGFRHYREEGGMKVLAGITTAEEVLQAG